MKEAFEKIKERLEEKWNDTVVLADEDDYFLGRSGAFRDALSIVSEVEAEYGNKSQTNADHIRSMSDGELAHFLLDFKCDGSVFDWLREVTE